MLGNEQGTNNHYFLTPEERKQQNLSNRFTVSVSSYAVATYKLLVELDNKGFSELENGEVEFGIINSDEVDNFIYHAEHISAENNNVTITLSAKLFEGNIAFGIKRCQSLE